ncbi:hypothetical protein M427DRAFT_158897 [Gonapodya prolifera JEL478]|uniref:Uncharacterized protein n=1 Tax=Gonapodya prolifera (strain JEL478) TaxID=1344416 RepID=A0A139A213_GONPJ|nr:hypothetical protein M427DRAFT_158897 [Gonapodya prolifera JEL478]|eukprot:KXS10729.1 hypothetical protein M427DRAFT_158897 [Gonapodya prolifera JEL478]
MIWVFWTLMSPYDCDDDDMKEVFGKALKEGIRPTIPHTMPDNIAACAIGLIILDTVHRFKRLLLSSKTCVQNSHNSDLHHPTTRSSSLGRPMC